MKKENVLEKLNEVKVIDKSDIINIKGYIQKKYPKNESKENTIILSDTINTIIYKSLEGLPDNLKLSVKNNTIKNTLGNNKTLITLNDIFKTCVMDENIKNHFTEELVSWVKVNTKSEVSLEDIYTYLPYTQVKENLYSESEIDTNITVSKGLKSLDSKKNKSFLLVVMCIFISASVYSISKGFYFNSKGNHDKTDNLVIESDKNQYSSRSHPNLHMPKYMRYEEINKQKLRAFLENRESLLAKEPYFSAIICQAKEFNINPIVLFSITGQEQNFVPEKNINAYKIANNPFNIFHSWKEYNTNINDAAKIVSRTVINLSKNIPKDVDPFLWIGRKYAEDKKWGKGVKTIFEDLTEYMKQGT